MNYSEMTNEELSIKVAKRRGWRFRTADDEGKGFLLDPDGHSIWINPLVQAVRRARPEIDLQLSSFVDENYDSVPFMDSAIGTEMQCWCYAPQFAEDLNAAIELLTEIKDAKAGELQATLYYTGIDWEISFMSGEHFSDENPARAICLAWLKWRDSEE